tara:strand:+ start:801 stop:1058 length:258 start_codon:yes stop_codon:yes gene_type:complete
MKVLKESQKRKRAEKKLNNDVSEKMGLFDKLPDICNACEKKFDKKDKSMVQSWNVVVREQEGIVRLYCPQCWESAMKAIREVENA